MTVSNPLHRVAIAGVGVSRQARSLPGETSASVTMTAIRQALADAGLTARDLDGANLCIGHPARLSRSRASMEGSRLFGGRPHWIGMKFMAISGLLEAASAIAYGNCEVVVVAAGQAAEHQPGAETAPWTRPPNPFYQCWGLHTPVEFALVAQQHMARYGTTSEQLAEVAATIRNNGSDNPEAVFHGRGPFSRADVLASRMIASPLHLLDCAMTSEGGAAFVLTTVERARDLRRPPVYILGGAAERQGPSFGLSRPPALDEVGLVGKWAATRAFAMAGVVQEDVDVCEFYDPSSFEIIRQFEAFGFCEPGEGGEFVMDGRIRRDGQFPVVTDGGTMSHSHPGIPASHLRVIESVRQLRGEGGARQVPDARVAMATLGGSGHLHCDVLLVGSEAPQ